MILDILREVKNLGVSLRKNGNAMTLHLSILGSLLVCIFLDLFIPETPKGIFWALGLFCIPMAYMIDHHSNDDDEEQ